jgi:tetratricopeptide (TPR) repeat protein
MDIPPGASNYVVEDSYRLPVDVELLGLLPHAHYLAREMEAWAILPSGAREWLLLIKHWDFNWQGAYRYTKPVSLPKGSTLQMRFTYDNSTNNARNPNVPPKAVSYGPQSSDEMAELWLQVLARNDNELTRLKDDHEIKMARVFLESDLAALRRDPNDARAHTDLGMALLGEGKLAEAEPHFQAALRAQPAFALAHYDYALLLRRLSRFDEAEAHFREDLRLAPHDFKAHGNLGAIFLEQGKLDTAQAEFESALTINPEDALARQGLEMLRRQRNP